MQSANMQRQFDLQRSTMLAVILVVAYSATMLALLKLNLPFWAVSALLLLLLFSLLHHMRRDAWLSAPSATVKLVLDGEDVVLTARSGNQLTGRLLQNSLVTPFLTVLNVLPQGAYRARSIIILPDSLDSESFRQLRVWLKWANPDYVA